MSDGYTIDVGPVHVLIESGGSCRPDCPHPDHCDITSPIDALHRDCLDARDYIREVVAQAIKRTRRWEPAPYPTEREET